MASTGYTLRAAEYAAVQMTECGTREPSIKLACWYSVCSAAQKLEGSNADMADTLRVYAERRLPGRDAVIEWLRASHANWSGRTVDAILAIDELWSAGVLARFETMPSTYAEWLDWRRDLRGLIRGMGYKMCSMAAYLMWPLDTPLICVDRHHMRRLGGDPERVPQCFGPYHARELEVLSEYAAYCDDLVRPAVWAHFMWSLERKRVGAEVDNDQAADHTRLSVRLY